MYLTYEAYLGYGGTLDEADFILAEFRARKRIDHMTDNRVSGMAAVPEAVKIAMMSIIRADAAVGADAQAGAPAVEAFAVDGYSERCCGIAERAGTLERQLKGEITRLLSGVKDDAGVELMFRGVKSG